MVLRRRGGGRLCGYLSCMNIANIAFGSTFILFANGCATKVASLVEIDVIGGILTSDLRQVKPRAL